MRRKKKNSMSSKGNLLLMLIIVSALGYKYYTYKSKRIKRNKQRYTKNLEIKKKNLSQKYNQDMTTSLFCTGSLTYNMCKQFKLISGHDFSNIEGIELDGEVLTLSVSKETLDQEYKLIRNKKKIHLMSMEFFLSETFLLNLKTQDSMYREIRIVICDKDGKAVYNSIFDAKKIFAYKAKDISRSISLALMYNNDRFYKKLVMPALID